MCGAHAAVRSLVGEMIDGFDRPTVVDIEAGLEHLSRGTARHTDTLLVVIEPYFKSMETGSRVAELGRELGISKIGAVANKIRSEADRRSVDEFCRGRDIDLFGVVPDDEAVRESDRFGISPLDHDSSAPAMSALAGIASTLRSPS